MPHNDSQESPDNCTPREQVIRVIDTLRPFIQGDGGDIEFVDFTEDGMVHVRLHGACVGCPGAVMTLRFGVEARLKECVPEVRGVVCVPQESAASDL